MAENGKRFAEFQKLGTDEKLDYLYMDVVELSNWRKRLVSVPAKVIYFLLAALSVATFVLNVMK